uniref:Uncharacterized protein n=1 Tax=Coccidioides posadasii RMSCC 3488 TaxID=454284 RepID=A0A0J6F3A5_COCPO|nr:hypothetical protein CPAG_03725 [Coccidioides posadasii RMSCC 3488]
MAGQFRVIYRTPHGTAEAGGGENTGMRTECNAIGSADRVKPERYILAFPSRWIQRLVKTDRVPRLPSTLFLSPVGTSSTQSRKQSSRKEQRIARLDLEQPPDATRKAVGTP